MGKGFDCPHCGKKVSKSFAIKSLSNLAKSEGEDFDEELNELAGADDDAEADGDDVEKGGHKKKGKKGMDVGNHMDSSRGPFKAGKMHSSSRGKGTGQTVQRETAPKNPIAMKKSFAVHVGQPQLVQYSHGSDDYVAKGIPNDGHQLGSKRNMRAESEAVNGQASE